MAFRRGSPPEDYPVIRPPPMRPPPARPPPIAPPRTVHFDDRRSYLESPPRGGYPTRGPSPPSPRRFVGDSPPQRYIEGVPAGYLESPPRRFPSRRSDPPSQYLSPEDSPPYRYSEGPRRFGPSSRPYSEDTPIGYRDEAAGRFGGTPGFHRTYHSESESPSPPPGYFRPPPPPPGGFVDEPSRRFGGSPQQGSRYAHDDSPPTGYADPRRFGGAHSRRTHNRSPPSPLYAEDQHRRFGGSPHQFLDDSPPEHFEDARRRFADGYSPSPPGGGLRWGYGEDPARRGQLSNAPAPSGRSGGPPPGHDRGDTSPSRFESRAIPPTRAEDPPGRSAPRFESRAIPPTRAEDPPGRSAPRFENRAIPPTRAEDPPGRSAPRFESRAIPPTRAEDPPGRSAPRFESRAIPPTRAEDAPGRSAGPPPRQFPDGSAPVPPGAPDPSGPPPPGYKESPPRSSGAKPREFAAAAAAGAAGAGVAGYAEDVAQRQGPSGIPPEPVTPGFGPPPRQFPGSPPPGYIGLGTPPQQSEEFPHGAPPPAADPGLHQGTPPRFPPDVFTAGALAHRPSPGRGSSGGSSPPGLVRYSGADPVPLRSQDGSSPDIYGGPRGPLGSTSPRYEGIGGRFDHSLDVYGALPPHATPPREGYHPPPPGLGQGGDAPLLGVPPGYATPQRIPGPRVHGDSPPIPDFLFFRPQRQHPSGYTASTPPREPRPRPAAHDAIFTADVVPIELDDKLKDVAPHRGNPGSSTGGGWKDMWAGFLFLLQIGGIAALCIIFGLQGLTHTILHYSDPNTFHINDWLPQLAAAVVTGAVFAISWQTAIRIAPVFMILVTVWTASAVTILVGIVLVATGRTLGLIGIAFFFAGICQALYAFVVRERIPFAGEMLKKVISVCNTHPSTFVVSYSFLFVSLVWMAIWIFGFSGSGIRPRHALVMAGLIASLAWTMQVFRNIVRVTVAGTVALIYFQERNMPRMASAIALLRACTSSFGSICFGSFFVPLVETPCHGLRRLNSQAGASEFLFSCVVCFLACYENLIRYFNKLGYIQVAIYGKPFVRASKDTWDMLRAQQVDVLVNDDLVSTILFLSCGIGGSLSALVGGIYTFVAHKSLTIIITIVSYLIGSLLTYVTLAVVESAVATYYVCFAEDPDSLQRQDGPFYERMWVRQMELSTPGPELSD